MPRPARRRPRRGLLDFLQWYRETGAAVFDRPAVQRYRALPLEAGLAPSTINQNFSATRALASEALDNGLLDPRSPPTWPGTGAYPRRAPARATGSATPG